MLDLGRAQVPRGSGSLEHARERKAVDFRTTLRPSDSLGQCPPDTRKTWGAQAVVLPRADYATAGGTSKEIMFIGSTKGMIRTTRAHLEVSAPGFWANWRAE